MSEPIQEQNLPGLGAVMNDSTAKAQPAKKAAKKAAKKVAKKATKKVAKKAVKKVAKKAAKRTAETSEQPATTKPEPAPKITAAREVAPPPVQAEAPRAAASNEDRGNDRRPKRFGRVPGGGPVSTRDDEPATESTEEKSAPQQTANHGGGNNGGNGGGNNGGNNSGNNSGGGGEFRDGKRKRNKRRRNKRRDDNGGEPDNEPQRQPARLDGPKMECNGMLELAPKGFGFLRVQTKNFEQARDDVFVPPEFIRKYNLRLAQWIHGLYQEGPRGPQLVEITTINGQTLEQANKLPHFDELKAVNPSKRISFETTPDRYTTRVIDIMSPIGRGQRGLIVSPPRSGKTTMLLHTAQAIHEKYEESMHLMVVLVDERPEEVTEFRRALPDAEIYASSNDDPPRNHCRIAELAIERAKRLVEAGQDVFLLMDSITRLARAYNNNMSGGGGGGGGNRGRNASRGRGIGSGGIMIGALEVPRRLFAAARNTRGGGSLTILATALIQTNSRADDAIFMEFKGTGNMELVLDRKIAENYIYPAVDIFKSGTRREELLLPEHMLHKIHLIRRGLSGHRPVEAMERLLFFLKKFPNNPQMLMEIKG